MYRAYDAAKRLESEYGLSVELIDGQTLVPFDYEILYNSVKKTGKLILGSDACERGSYLHTIAANISQLAFDYLDAPPAVVGAKNWIVPPAELEDDYYPLASSFLDAYHTQIKPLPGYEAREPRHPAELMRLSKEGML